MRLIYVSPIMTRIEVWICIKIHPLLTPTHCPIPRRYICKSQKQRQRMKVHCYQGQCLKVKIRFVLSFIKAIVGESKSVKLENVCQFSKVALIFMHLHRLLQTLQRRNSMHHYIKLGCLAVPGPLQQVSKKVWKICSTRRETSYSRNNHEGAYCSVSVYLAI